MASGNARCISWACVSDGGVHSDMAHAEALLEMAGERGLSRVRIDAFTDGRDVDPTQSGAGFMHDLQAFCEKVSEKYGNEHRHRDGRRPLLRHGPRQPLGPRAACL